MKSRPHNLKKSDENEININWSGSNNSPIFVW